MTYTKFGGCAPLRNGRQRVGMDLTKGTFPLKNNIIPQLALAITPAKLSAVGRFQIYRESRGGDFIPGFSTDSDVEAIEAFMFQAPSYDGGEIRVLDRTEQRMIAFVK